MISVCAKVEKTIYNTYNDYYKDYNGETKQVKYAEPYWLYDEEKEEYYYSYHETLKEVFGFSMYCNPSTDINLYNSPINEKCFFSLPIDNENNGSHIYLDLNSYFPNMSYGSKYVLLFDGVFKYPNQNEVHLERTVTFYYTSPLSWKDPEICSRFPELAKWYKGDGHLHSLYSDGDNWIYDFVGRPNSDPSFKREDDRRHQEKDNNYVTKENTIAYRAKNQGLMDWIIITDHAGYLFSPAQGNFGKFTINGWIPPVYPCYNEILTSECPQVGNENWFNFYIWECRSAEQELGNIGIIPMEEIATTNECRSDDDTSCLDKKLANFGGHILNYNLQNGPQPYNTLSGRIADDVWGGNTTVHHQITRDEINYKCGCVSNSDGNKRTYAPTQPDGINGWGVVAHPEGANITGKEEETATPAYKWMSFPKKQLNWFKSFSVYESKDKHICPSVARSIMNFYSPNKGKGFFGIELDRRGITRWDEYLFADVKEGIYEHFNEDKDTSAMKFNPTFNKVPGYLYDPSNPGNESQYSFGNNFVVGLANSDDHQTYWSYQEDITRLKCLEGKIPISDIDERKIPGFEDGCYIMAKLKSIPWLTKCTYVYSDCSPIGVNNHRNFLKNLRSCGENKGVTASIGGGWATFKAKTQSSELVSSGGKIDIKQGEQSITLYVDALSPYKGSELPIKEIRVYACCGELNAYDKKEYCPVTFQNIQINVDWPAKKITTIDTLFNDPENPVYSILDCPIPIEQKHIAFYDYIRVEVEFLGNDRCSIAYCNPILVKNINAQ
ncbi:MAG: hypothetical protein PHD83_01465 [Caldisericia bacterium]|nr:hypothetical protein [Caldisericia bacterium]